MEGPLVDSISPDDMHIRSGNRLAAVVVECVCSGRGASHRGRGQYLVLFDADHLSAIACPGVVAVGVRFESGVSGCGGISGGRSRKNGGRYLGLRLSVDGCDGHHRDRWLGVQKAEAGFCGSIVIH